MNISSLDEATRLVAELEQQGFVERESSPFEAEDGPRWRPTINGNALAKASAAPPVHRTTAEQHVERFIARLRSVRELDFAYVVAEAVVFGSYLTATTRLSDVDLAVRLVPKSNGLEFEAACEKRIAMTNRRFSNITEHVFWPHTEVLQFVRGRARCLSIEDHIGYFIWSRQFRVLYVDVDWAQRFEPLPLGRRPLVLDTSDRIRDALRVGGGPKTEPQALEVTTRWARAGGYDSILLPTAALRPRSAAAPFSKPISLAF